MPTVSYNASSLCMTTDNKLLQACGWLSSTLVAALDLWMLYALLTLQ